MFSLRLGILAIISIEASFSDKSFELLHVFLLHRIHKKGVKYEIELMKIDQDWYRCRLFSPQPLTGNDWF